MEVENIENITTPCGGVVDCDNKLPTNNEVVVDEVGDVYMSGFVELT